MPRKRTPSRQQTGRVIGYVRASTGRQELGPEHQRAQLQAEADRRGWELELVEDNGKSGTSMAKRTGLAYALDRLERGDADALVVTKLDRLARSTVDFGRILAQSQEQGWAVVVLALGVDTGTPNGKLVARIMMDIAEWEAEMISERTRDALAVKQERGEQVGRQSTLPAEIADRIVAERAAGSTWQAIADRLNADQIPTGQGGKEWRPSSVQAIHRRAG
jgi:DNA invertase Pin-like site-specific DNA recombinase